MQQQHRPTSSEGESWSTIENTSSSHASDPRQPVSHSKRRSSRTPTRQNLEVEEVPSTDSGLSWVKRVSWLGTAGNRNRRGDQAGGTVNSLEYWLEYRPGSADAYFGGTMDSGDRPMVNTSPVEAMHGSSSMRDFPSPTANDSHPYATGQVPPIGIARQSSFQRFSSWFSSNRRPQAPPLDPDDEESICDFQESEWTPQDTSYGAAIPVGGWIPKTIRRLIEWTLIGTVICCVAFLVITTSIKISGSDSRSNSTTVSGMHFNDDAYTPYTYNYANRNDDDNSVADNYNSTAVDDAYAEEDEAAADDDASASDSSNDDDTGEDAGNSQGYNPDNDGSFFDYAYGHN